KAYNFIKQNDSIFAQKISKTDRYRIEKWHEIYLKTNKIATEYFKSHPPLPAIKNIKIYNLEIDKKSLKDKISLRTKLMIDQGLVEEIYFLEKKYGRDHTAMGAIGIKETLAYLDGKLDLQGLKESISIHTAQLAKRQITFNKTQFKDNIFNINPNLNKNISFFS
ncbi:MAG: tRNA (adenosine(37)-N6)-dimethylallyltransferase MiaA, partial [Epsilonproteobacteria bacterium]|nr:tRNA (adenosine(37)-N6)-dimethylallyltransferase MiaA [Campylobacterota bacterium]